jgi:hypothetical protein
MQDEKLRKAVKSHKKDWVKIGAAIGRSADDAEDRWKTVVHPRLSRGPWTPEVRRGRGMGGARRAAHACRARRHKPDGLSMAL